MDTPEQSLKEQELLLRSLVDILCGTVVHELNNPLAAIKGFAQLIEMTGDPAKMKEQAGEIVRGANRMQGIIEQLRFYSNREAGKTSFSHKVEINGCVRRAESLVRRHIEDNGITLNVELEEGLDEIWGNAVQIESLVYKLLTTYRDAVAEDPDKGTVTIRTATSADGQPTIYFEETTGKLLSMPAQDDIFEVIGHSLESCGITLGIIRRVVEKHKGTLHVNRDDNTTRLRCIFPVDRRAEKKRKPEKESAAPSGTTEESKPQEAPKRPTILIIDDDEAVAEVIAMSVEDEFEPTVICDPRKATGEIEKTRYDAIITDFRMPGLSGLGVVEHVKKHQPGTAIMIISGYASTDKELQFAASKGAGILEKPFESPEALKGAIRKQMKTAEA